MTNVLGRLCYWLGFLIYVVSFWLTAVGGPGVWTTRPPSMATWAIDALLIPLFYSHQYSFGVLLEDLTFRNVSFFSVGWINPIFIITMILMLVDRTPRLSAIFRCIVLLLVGLCWVALIYRDVYPREGYFLWTAGIFLVLFSRGLPRWPVRCTQCLINAVTGQVNLLPAFAAESRRRGDRSRNIADRPISASIGPHKTALTIQPAPVQKIIQTSARSTRCACFQRVTVRRCGGK